MALAMKSMTSTKASIASRRTATGRVRGHRAVTRSARVDGGIYKEPHHGFSDEFIEETCEKFPEEGICDTYEAMVLLVAGGYSILDVRAKSEIEFVGNFPLRNAAHGAKFKEIPVINATRKYDSEVGAKVYQQTINTDFKSMVERAFPDKEAKIIVACSDGRNRTLQALEMMDEMGYVNICGLRGGYNMWNREFDSNFRRRNLPGVFKEEYQHGADGCGVHATGAGFQNQDAFQFADWRDDTEWLDALEPVAA